MDRDSSSRPTAIVASGHAGRRSSLRAELDAAGFGVVEATTAGGALSVIGRADQVRLAFVDLDLRSDEPHTFTELLRTLGPRVAVWVITDEEGEDDALRAVEAGARGLLLERHLDTPLVASIASGVLAEHRLEHSVRVAETAVLESEYRYRALFGLARDPMLMADVEGRVIEANQAANDLLAPEDEGLVGRRLVDFLSTASDRDRLRAALSFDADDSDVALRVMRTDASGEERTLAMVARPRRDVFGRPHGLFCSLAPPREASAGSTFALLFVEIAGIDVLEAPGGRPSGDDIAAALSDRILDTVREGDIVTRVGIDEFVVLLGEIERQEMGSIVADRLRSRLSEPLVIGDRRVRLECSIGRRDRPAAPWISEDLAGDALTNTAASDIVLLELPRRRAGGTIVGGAPGQADIAHRGGEN